jgi:hypothetical protein
VKAAVEPQPQLFPHAILGSNAELNPDVQIIDLTRCRTDDVEIQPSRKDPGWKSVPCLNLTLGATLAVNMVICTLAGVKSLTGVRASPLTTQ